VAFQTVEIAKKFTTLHFQYSDKILKLAKKKAVDGTPINLPLWWLDPTDEEALTIDSGKPQGQNPDIFIILKISQ
jgi:alpha-glucosidase (family GH31 glycosyl hydrolase)